MCEKTYMLKHLAVYEPDVLFSNAWQAHVRECAPCIREWRGFVTSLAVYCRIEQDDAARLSVAPGWEALSRRLREQHMSRRRATAATGPWLAGVLGLFLAGGIFSWGLWNDSGEPHRRVLALQEDVLMIRMEDHLAGNRVSGPREFTRVAAPTAGGYRVVLPEARARRRASQLPEPRSFGIGRPSGEVAILPFGHDRAAIPYVMPVTSAPANAYRLEYPTGFVTSPVR